ncbi:pilus assembly protein [Methylovirgula sp. 4M-Z18]|nr:pilus assembly protein [Methylovirgula sp. 4M-Z18]
MMTMIFVFVLGGIDFLFAFYQYNSAAKAVELGARIASVWDPVATGLNSLSTAVVTNNTATAGDEMPSFSVTCNGSTATCTCTGTCTGVSGYNSAAMNTIVYGRGNNGSCNAPTSLYTLGMCSVFFGDTGALTPANVIVTYTQTGLGFAGRPGGPVPTITVQLQNVPFKFYFLGSLLKFGNVTMPPLTTSVTGEYLSSSAPS